MTLRIARQLPPKNKIKPSEPCGQKAAFGELMPMTAVIRRLVRVLTIANSATAVARAVDEDNARVFPCADRTAVRLAYWTMRECFLSRLKFREGPFHFVTMPNNTCGLWSYVAQDYERDLLRFLNSHLKRGNVFVDAGANIGLFTANASRAVGPTGRVIAFEAHPLTSSVLAENVALNKLANVTNYQRSSW